MKKLALFYNPYSGNGLLLPRIDSIIDIFQQGGYYVYPFRFSHGLSNGDFLDMRVGGFDSVCVCGGDGTVNIVINELLNRGLNPVVGIIPSGTANDFASFLGLPVDYEEAARVIARGDFIQADLGLAGRQYFVNVCASGILSTVSQAVDSNLKQNFGKLAYYIRGLQELNNLTPLNVTIEYDNDGAQNVIEESIYLSLVLNSAGTGGFRDLSRGASIVDGKLEFIAVKAVPFADVAKVFIRMLSQANDYRNDPGVIYFKSSHIKITPHDVAEKYLVTDLDGEQGPNLPLDIKVVPGRLKLFV